MNIAHNAFEMEIKILAASWLAKRYGSSGAGVLINEYAANNWKARADLVYVNNNQVISVEIKSSRDKIQRLEGQIKNLKLVSNRVDVIVSANHAEKAKAICARESVGLHIVTGGTVKTVLAGRSRSISRHALAFSLFPASLLKKKDFIPSEEHYRNLLRTRYKLLNLNFDQKIDPTDIRNTNPNHVRQQNLKLKRQKYREDLSNLISEIQSTHSSSRSFSEIDTP